MGTWGPLPIGPISPPCEGIVLQADPQPRSAFGWPAWVLTARRETALSRQSPAKPLPNSSPTEPEHNASPCWGGGYAAADNSCQSHPERAVRGASPLGASGTGTAAIPIPRHLLLTFFLYAAEVHSQRTFFRKCEINGFLAYPCKERLFHFHT